MKFFHRGARAEIRRDFSLNIVGMVLAVLVIAVVLALWLLTGIAPSVFEYLFLLGAPLAAVCLLSLFPRWTSAVKLLLLVALSAAALPFSAAGYGVVFALVGVLVAPAIQKMEEWERAIVLRFGRFHRVRGPGLFLLFPFADRIARRVDLRIRVTDFAAQSTLTLDSVTVTVDAICFWLVWDAEKAVCEVQNYEEAVILSSQTALRNAVSKHDLSTFLARGEDIEKEIRSEVDKKTTDWGITVQHIEITDIQIPDALQDSLSRLAQMEREKMGRILLAEAEIDIARRLESAAAIYGANSVALKLKSLSILNEGLKAGNSMMLVPDSITEELQSTDLFGLQALNETKRAQKKSGGQK